MTIAFKFFTSFPYFTCIFAIPFRLGTRSLLKPNLWPKCSKFHPSCCNAAVISALNTSQLVEIYHNWKNTQNDRNLSSLEHWFKSKITSRWVHGTKSGPIVLRYFDLYLFITPFLFTSNSSLYEVKISKIAHLYLKEFRIFWFFRHS